MRINEVHSSSGDSESSVITSTLLKAAKSERLISRSISIDITGSEDATDCSRSSTSNIITTVFWFVYELMGNPELLSKIRAEVATSRNQTGTGSVSVVDDEKLCVQPYILSAYAEVLRLRTYNLVVTSSDRGDFNFREWILPKDKLVAISTHTGHMDSRAWNTGSIGTKRPLTTFWAERFLTYPSDPLSGPLRPKNFHGKSVRSLKRDGCQDVTIVKECQPQAAPQFSLTGLSGIWTPYGGGHSICPGRYLAKKQILLSVGLLTATYDFEFVRKEKFWLDMKRLIRRRSDFQPDMRYFGMGVLPCKEKVYISVKERVA